MNPTAYHNMAETQSRHWWFLGRKSIVSDMLEDLAPTRSGTILEVGCGTGGNLELLAKFGEVSAFEMDATARDIAMAKTGNAFDIRLGACPDQLPSYDRRFDLICAFDVLEHIDRDVETLAALRGMLAPGGKIFLTVPAYQWLYGAHDAFLHHQRRYSRQRLLEALQSADLAVNRISYFNTILAPLAIVARIKDRVVGAGSYAGFPVPPRLINTAFATVFGAERFLLRRIDLPFGISLLAVLEAQRTQGVGP